MTTGSHLASELAQVLPPAGVGYTVRSIPTATGYSIGRGADGVVVLLTPYDEQPDPPTRLRSLTLEPRVRVRIEDGTGLAREEERGLVELRLTDDAMLGPFLAVAAAVIRLLGPHPQAGSVSAGMRRLVKIFDRTDAPRGSVLGLFGELLVVATAADPSQLVDAWHAQVDAKFDFSAEGSRLEVKTTTKGTRQHIFDLDQLRPVQGAVVRIASVMTTETHAGTSIGEMVARVEAAMGGDAERQVRVHQQVAMTLGSDWIHHLGHRFDETQAERTLVILDPKDIPKVDDPPAEILSVALTVDCAAVPVDRDPPGLSSLVRLPD